MLRYTKWEDWSLTITNSVQCLYECWDTPSEKTGLWQCTKSVHIFKMIATVVCDNVLIVSSVFKMIATCIDQRINGIIQLDDDWIRPLTLSMSSQSFSLLFILFAILCSCIPSWGMVSLRCFSMRPANPGLAGFRTLKLLTPRWVRKVIWSDHDLMCGSFANKLLFF